MIAFISTFIVIASLVLGVVGVVWAARDRLIDDGVLALSAALLLALIAQAGVALARSEPISDGGERATFLAYACTLPLVPVGAAFLAIKEKSRFGMVVVAVGAFAVLVMTARMGQIWGMYA
ncbi:MAG: hypothetical protein LWW86_06010 [Micrococcales bacterium]|nr:hypothetical protein [Micrococcales bacterium]